MLGTDTGDFACYVSLSSILLSIWLRTIQYFPFYAKEIHLNIELTY